MPARLQSWPLRLQLRYSRRFHSAFHCGQYGEVHRQCHSLVRRKYDFEKSSAANPLSDKGDSKWKQQTEKARWTSWKAAGEHIRKSSSWSPGILYFQFSIIYFSFYLRLHASFPFCYLFINTISDNSLVQKGLINFYPVGIHFDNYAALRVSTICSSPSWFRSSRTVIGTALMVLASAFVGYLDEAGNGDAKSGTACWS